MRVSELYVYPIKSARGIPLTRAQLEERGFQHDRRWMLVDAQGVFISQRELPRMALIDIGVAADGLMVSAEGTPGITIPLSSSGESIRCRIWKDTVDTVPVGAEADQWFSAFLESSCRLVYMPDAARRVVDRDYVPEERMVGFADAFPLLIIGQGSLDQLNRKLNERGEMPVSMHRFRPNIVVAGSRPHEEDEWEQIRIGAVDVDVVKPCARCVITTVDIATGEAGKEPLRTLARYRKRGSKVMFGQNAVHKQLQEIAVGDQVTVTSMRY
jgi:uncharacterized protein YcbX